MVGAFAIPVIARSLPVGRQGTTTVSAAAIAKEEANCGLNLSRDSYLGITLK